MDTEPYHDFIIFPDTDHEYQKSEMCGHSFMKTAYNVQKDPTMGLVILVFSNGQISQQYFIISRETLQK